GSMSAGIALQRAGRNGGISALGVRPISFGSTVATESASNPRRLTVTKTVSIRTAMYRIAGTMPAKKSCPIEVPVTTPYRISVMDGGRIGAMIAAAAVTPAE